MAHEGLARFIDHWTIEFVRTYPHPIERVWQAVTALKRRATSPAARGRSEAALFAPAP
jgi:hypothetical protein